MLPATSLNFPTNLVKFEFGFYGFRTTCRVLKAHYLNLA